MNRTLPSIGIIILLLTLIAKVASLLSGGPPGDNEWLQVSNRSLTVIAASAEMALLGIWPIFGARRFMQSLFVASCGFLTFHILNGYLGDSPCVCLGGFMSSNERFGTMVSISLASVLFGISLASVLPHCPTITTGANPYVSSCAAIAVAIGGSLMALHWGDLLIGDESMEVAKVLLLKSNPQAFREIWNDQSPLLTHIWAISHSVVANRIIIVVLWFIAVLAISRITMTDGAGWGVLLLPVVLLVATSGHIATMTIEPAAYATASLVWLLIASHPTPRTGIVAGIIGGIAIAMKPTAGFALVAPFVWLLTRNRKSALYMSASSLAIGGVILYSLISDNNMINAVRSHSVLPPNGHEFDPSLLGAFWPVGIMAIVGTASRIKAGMWKQVIPWASSFAVAVAIHLFHRPWWGYYNIHLFVPVCVLAGYGIADLRRIPLGLTVFIPASLASLITLLWLHVANQPFVLPEIPKSTIAKLKSLETMSIHSANCEILAMSEITNAIPDLTIIPLKRQWDGLSERKIWELVVRAKPDVIVTRVGDVPPKWMPYRPTHVSEGYVMFLRSDLPGERVELPDAKKPLKRFGL